MCVIDVANNDPSTKKIDPRRRSRTLTAIAEKDLVDKHGLSKAHPLSNSLETSVLLMSPFENKNSVRYVLLNQNRKQLNMYWHLH